VASEKRVSRGVGLALAAYVAWRMLKAVRIFVKEYASAKGTAIDLRDVGVTLVRWRAV
jgi:hypothetical protein